MALTLEYYNIGTYYQMYIIYCIHNTNSTRLNIRTKFYKQKKKITEIDLTPFP